MRHFYYSKFILLLAAVFTAFSAIGQQLSIKTGEIKLEQGETMQLMAEYLDADSVAQEVSISWYIVPDTLGSVDDAGVFTAEKPGKGYLFAEYETLLDSVEVEVEASEIEEEEEMEEGDDDEIRNWGTLSILNENIELEPGETLQLEAAYTDTAGNVQEVRINWHTDPGYLGKANKDGLFTAGHPGEGMLYAKYKSLKDSIEIKVIGEVKDEENEEPGEVNDSTDYPKVKVVPGKIKIAAGDSVELVAFYINELDEKIDTTFSWAVLPAELGEFPDSASAKFFAADTTGNGYIVAWLGDLADTVKLSVTEPKSWPYKGKNNARIAINPGDTTVQSGDVTFLQYSATYKTEGKKHENAELKWSLSGDSIGTIDEMTGLVTLSGETGLALVKVEYSNFSVSAELLVVDANADNDVNQITIHRVLPDGNELAAQTLNEGDTYEIGGLPFPLNMLNGGMLHFPYGSIDEDILIYMFIPEEYTEVDNDSAEVSFNEEIITGVKFNVQPVDSAEIVEPYYFNIPLNLSLVYDQELLDSLGLTPEDLDVFFADNTGFTGDGTSGVTVDTVKNKIYASVEHFSTIVVKQKSAQTLVSDVFKADELLTVYPNPFKQSANILLQLNEQSKIELSIYNLYGQKVKTLINENRTEGAHIVTWDGKNQSGQLVVSGVYFCRVVKNGERAEVKRLIFER